MANSNNNAAKSVNEVLTANGGHLDRFDIEAMKEANAIGRARSMTPQRLGRKAAGFGRPAYHPNRAEYGEAAPRRFYASLSGR